VTPENQSPTGHSGKTESVGTPGNRNFGFPEFPGATRRNTGPRTHPENTELPESNITPDSGSHPEDSGFTESPIGVRAPGENQRNPGNWIHPELRVPVVTRSTRGYWSHPEESGFPESPEEQWDPVFT